MQFHCVMSVIVFAIRQLTDGCKRSALTVSVWYQPIDTSCDSKLDCDEACQHSFSLNTTSWIVRFDRHTKCGSELVDDE